MIIVYLTSRPVYYLIRPWELASDLYKEIRAFIQRGSRGYADCDLWGLDEYLLGIMGNGLKYLGRKDTGCIANWGKYKSQARWEKALNKNADRIRLYLDGVILPDTTNKSWKSWIKKYLKSEEEVDKAVKFVFDNFFDLWD
jgi:hypothetical protein